MRPSPSARTGRPTVAVVDDDRDTVEAMAAILPIGDYAAACFFGGRSFLKAFDQLHPDAVVLDLSMPGVDGIEVLTELREKRELDDLPVIVVTGTEDPARLAHARRLKPTAVLRKPIDPDAILATLDSALGS